MKCRIAGQVAAMVLALTEIAGPQSPSIGQAAKPATPQRPDRDSGRSFPPDTTPYVRPVIPEDRMRTPKI
jgi:hypothetical protein